MITLRYIYNSQYNIGLEIVNKFIKRGALDLHRPFSYINLILFGPTFIDLIAQIEKDMDDWKFATAGQAHFLNSVITNSSSLNSPGKSDNFFKWFQNEEYATKTLHVVVHDEAHWGIAQGSEIHKFLQQLNHLQGILNRQLLVLCVSATIFVLKDIKLFQDENEYRADWNELRKSDERFFTPNYLAWNQLRIEVDSVIGKMTTVTAASEAVVQEYINAMTAVVKTEPHSSYAKWVIDDLMKEEPCVAVIRLGSQEDAKKLQNAFLNFRRCLQSGKEIYVVALYTSQPSISAQLKNQCYAYHDGVRTVADISEISCVLIVVDKLRMGERIPQITKFYDVRSCYLLGKLVESEATCIQDVGRCAGHNKKPAVVFAGIDLLSPDSYKQSDRLLCRKSRDGAEATTPRKDHAEYLNGGVYTALKSYMVILDAEPQIGKTGAILSMLSILRDLIIGSSNMEVPTLNEQDVHMQELDQPTDCQSSKLRELTKFYSKMVNESPKSFHAVFRGDNWKTYHQLLVEEQKKWPDMGNIFKTIKFFLTNIDIDTESESPLLVADCGCGSRGLFFVLLDNPTWVKQVTHVHGFDIDESICELQEHNTSLIKFIAHVGNMAVAEDENSYHIILYALSLFENDITPYMEWAHKHIKQSGRLIIYDTKSRFSSDFTEQMDSHGFSERTTESFLFFYRVRFFQESKKYVQLCR